MRKRLLILVVMVMVMLTAVPAQAGTRYSKGNVIEDFTFSTYDGQSHSFYELLKDKDAILLNIWASWCTPCRREFPFMQEAYEEYRDRVEIVALSCEATDTPEKLAKFAAENKLTFKIGQAPDSLANAIGVSSIPVSLMIDRYGTICFMEAGAQPDTDTFRRLFDAFLGDDYTESVLFDAIPAGKPDVVPSDPSALCEALGSSAKNPANKYAWPMVVTEKDGRMVVASANGGKTSSRAEITAEVDAKVGEAIVVTFKTSTEALYDLLNISVNGKTVKRFGGEHDWMTYAIPVESDGIHTVKVSYVKDRISDAGSDMVWVDGIAVAENAEEALAANPYYPIGAATEAIVTTPGAKEVTITDPSGLLAANFGHVRCYIVGRDTADVSISLDKAVDPECGLVYFSYDKAQIPFTKIMTKNGYVTSTKVDSVAETGAYCTFASIYPDIISGVPVTTLLFLDEENLNSFVTRNSLGEWKYADNDGSEASSSSGQSFYTLLCVDSSGIPIPGVLLQVCNDEVCQVFVTDVQGKATFETEAYAWEIHVLQAPEGYVADPTQITLAPVEGGEVIITLTTK